MVASVDGVAAVPGHVVHGLVVRLVQLLLTFLRALLVPALLIGFWWAMVASRVISANLLPSPTRVFGPSAERLFSNPEVYTATASSVMRIFAGWLLAGACGVLLGLTAGLSQRARLMLEIPMNAGRSLPPAAIIPLALLWLGIGDIAAISLVVFVAVWPVLMNTMTGVETVPRVQQEAALTLGANRRQLIATVLIPASLASILVGLRISMGLAWMAVVLSELVGVKHGLGALLLSLQNNGDVSQMLLVVLLIAVLGLAVDVAFRRITAPLLRWRQGVVL